MLGETEDTKSKNMINDILHPNMENQGTFNENLRRSFGKNIITSMSQENKHKSIRRKIPQVSSQNLENSYCNDMFYST